MHKLHEGELLQKLSHLLDFIFYSPPPPQTTQSLMSVQINSFKILPHYVIFFYIQALNKKESKGGLGSPCGDDSDHEGDFNLTPRTEAKYNKIDEEFHLMMQRNQINGVRVRKESRLS